MSLKILLAVDGSQYSDMAIETLKAFNFPPGTEITVMTVVPEHVFLGGITLHGLRKGMGSREDIKKTEEKKAAELLSRTVEALSADGINIDSIFYRGKPAELIIEQTQKRHFDLTVIGSKGIGNSRRYHLGSTAHKVMRHANCSVLLVREKTEKIRSVLLATDGSEHADNAAGFIRGLSLSKHCRFIIVTVLQSHPGNLDSLMTMGMTDADSDRKLLLAELRRAEEQAARQIAQDVIKRFQQDGYETSLSVLRGDPVEEILRVSKSRYPDMIVLGAKGLTESKSFLMGNVSQRIARLSDYSVLITRVH